MLAKRLLALFLFLLALHSCKKKNEAAPVVTPGETGTELPPVSSANLSNCYGEFNFIYDTSLHLQSGTVGAKIAEANFYTLPMTDKNAAQIEVGSVIINGIRYRTHYNNYSDSTKKAYAFSVFTVSVAGNSIAPAISFVYQEGRPHFADTNLIPYSVKKSVGIKVKLTGIINADSTIVRIRDGRSHTVTKGYLTSGLSSVDVDLKSADLKSLVVDTLSNGGVDIRVLVVKRHMVRVNRRDYIITFNRSYTKYFVGFEE